MSKISVQEYNRLERLHRTSEKRLGRKPLPEGQKKEYHRHPISLRNDQVNNLNKLAEADHYLSRSGPNHGNPSWRTMIALTAEKAPEIMRAIKLIRRMARSHKVVFPTKAHWWEIVPLIAAHFEALGRMNGVEHGPEETGDDS